MDDVALQTKRTSNENVIKCNFLTFHDVYQISLCIFEPFPSNEKLDTLFELLENRGQTDLKDLQDLPQLI